MRRFSLSILLFIPLTGIANPQLVIKGVSGALYSNTQIQLATLKKERINDDEQSRNAIKKRIMLSLRALGYYQPTIRFVWHAATKKGQAAQLFIYIDKGKPVKLGTGTLILRGDAKQDADYQTWVKRHWSVPGQILNHGTYEDFKKGLASLALRNGYFDSEFKVHRLDVSPQRHLAFWYIDYDSGRRYHFGDVTFQGAQIRHDYLQNLVPFQRGDNYSAYDLAKLNQRLSTSGWFSSVIVTPEVEQARASKILPLTAVVIPKVKNSIETGVGYATDVGPRLKANWKRPWVNERGQSIEASFNVSAPEQQLDISYKIPLKKAPLEQYYVVQSGAKRTDLNDTKADSVNLALARYWEGETGWQKAVKVRWSLDHFTQGLATDTTMLIYPGVGLNRIRSRGGLMPLWGDAQRYSIDISDALWGSDINFIILQAQQTWIRTLAQKHRFIARGNVGWADTSNFNRVPPDLRFFAGGDRSIRGYKYKNIAPRDSNGKLIGAPRLATGSIEYQYNMVDKWWGALFIDSGEAVNRFNRHDIKTGAGVGIRWASPVGPIKLDIARPLGDSQAHGIQFYIGLGPEL